MPESQPIPLSEAQMLLDRLAAIELSADERDRMIRVALVNGRWDDHNQISEVSAMLHTLTVGVQEAMDLMVSVAPALRERSERLVSEARAGMAARSDMCTPPRDPDAPPVFDTSGFTGRPS